MTELTQDNHKYDNMLFHMLTECKSLPVFLNEIFGFLSRRTDFYHIADGPNSPVGLPEGLAENLVKHAFYKWKPCSSPPQIMNEQNIPTYGEEIVVSEDISSVSKEIVVSDDICITKESNESLTQNVDKEMNNCTLEHNINKFSSSEHHNGAVYEDYSWSQNITEVDINVNLPEGTVGKDLVISILPDKISVKCKDTVLLEGPLCQKCKHKEAIWAIDKQNLEIHLEKCREVWWDCLIQTEPRLDLSKIDCSRPYEDLSEEAQVKIQELQWNAERKRLGLPTSDEIAKQEMLKKAWYAEGSPFSGPFNPSTVMFN